MLDLKDCIGLSLTLQSNLDHNNYMWSKVLYSLNENHSSFLE